MRKYLALFLAVLLLAGPAIAQQTDGRDESPGTGVILNQGIQIIEPHRSFRLVRVVPGNHDPLGGATEYVYSISKGALMIWWTGTSGSDGRTVAECAVTTGDTRIAGVLATTCEISSDLFGSLQYVTDDTHQSNWAYLQTYGKVDVRQSSTVSAGDALICGSITGGAATVSFNEFGGSGGTGNPQQLGIGGFFLQTDTTAGEHDTTPVFLRGL